MTLAQQLGIPERAYDVYRILWGPHDRKGVLSIFRAHGKYPVRGGELGISLEEMATLLRELQEASFLLALNDMTTGERKYVRTDSGRKRWVQVCGN